MKKEKRNKGISMLDQKNDKAHIKQVLADVISIAMSHIQDIALKLKDLDINESNIKDKSPEIVQKSVLLNNILTIINDAIHPAHDISKELYPGAVDFIDMCIVNHKLAIERKLISAKCGCYKCKIENPV